MQADTAFNKKVSEFRFGELPKPGDGTSFPSVKVTTTDRPWENADTFGISIPNSDNQVTTIFSVIITVNEATPDDAKKALGDLINDAIRILHDNPRLTKSDGTDAVCIRSTITAIGENGENRGTPHQVATITIKCQMGSAWIFMLPGNIRLDLISKPLESPGINLFKRLTDAGRKIFTPIDRTGQLHVEYDDHDPAIHDMITDMVLDAKTIDVTLKFGDDYTRTYTVVPGSKHCYCKV